MIPRDVELEEAQELLLGRTAPMLGESLPTLQALGRISFQDHFAGEDLPPYPQSAMDGYAVAVGEKSDSNCYQIIERLRPQDTPLSNLHPGQAAGVVTGGPLPDGTVAVMPQELAKVDGNNVIFSGRIEAGSNIKPQGEDYQAGDLLVKQRTALNPALISVLAAFGNNKVKVFCRPRVAIINFGPEIVPCHLAPLPGQKRDSNGPLLAGFVHCDGGTVVSMQAVGNKSSGQLKDLLKELFYKADVILTTGGTAQGVEDQALYVLKQVGAELLFRGIKMKPGNHSTAAVRNEKIIISLSGNPAACIVGYHLLAVPILRQMQGLEPYTGRMDALCTNSFMKKGNVRRFVYAQASCCRDGMRVTIFPAQKSSMLRPAANCNALIDLPSGQQPLRNRQTVKAILLGPYSSWDYSGIM